MQEIILIILIVLTKRQKEAIIMERYLIIKKVIEINPNDAEAFYNRGISKKNIGDLNGACFDWR